MAKMTLQGVAKRNKETIFLLEPNFGKRVSRWLIECNKLQLQILIYSGFRSIAEQTKLHNDYLAGKIGGPVAAPGNSYHNYGLAVDYVPLMLTKFGYQLAWGDREGYLKAQKIGLNHQLTPINGEMAHIQDARFKTFADIPKGLIK